MDTKLLTIRTLVSALSSSSDQTRLAALRHLRRTSNEDPAARPLIAGAGAVPVLAAALYSPSHPIQEHAAATLLNLSITDRRPLASSPALLDALAHLLSRHASSSAAAAAVQAAAATLYSLLTVVAEFRTVVGAKTDILRALVGIISHPDSSTGSVKDALKASFGVALHPPSRITLIRLGAVPALFALVAKGKDGKRRVGIIEDATAVIAQVAGCEDSEEAFRKVSGISTLAMMLCSESGSCSLRTKENAVAALLNLVRCGSERVVGEVREKVGAMDGIAYVQEHGSAKGKSKAVAFLKLLLDDGSNGQIVEDLYPVESDTASSSSWSG
ncbi:U-box domain-containing protein 2 [Spatholobus suberectus]|nr:U-box domain-containing protein 2 [Spatholobus suberectus]